MGDLMQVYKNGHMVEVDYFDLPTTKPKQYFVFETLKLNAGTHSWEEQLRMMEERTIFHDRVIIITSQGSGKPKLKMPDHYIVDRRTS
jgi:hypothetical protein